MQLDPHALHLGIRWLHVAAMATAFGGAVTVFALAARSGPRSDAADQALLDVASRYEWLFWGAAGVLAMTGIGNVAAFGAGLPAAGTGWGATFSLKLASVVALVVLSLPRTLAVTSIRTAIAIPVRARLRCLYGATAAVFASILALAVWLAHG